MMLLNGPRCSWTAATASVGRGRSALATPSLFAPCKVACAASLHNAVTPRQTQSTSSATFRPSPFCASLATVATSLSASRRRFTPTSFAITPLLIRNMGSNANDTPLSIQFAEKLSHYGIESASKTDVDLAVQAFIDTIGCILVGRPEEVVSVVSKIFGHAPGKALIIGSGSQRTSNLDATVINGVACHALDYDDMVNGGHPSVPIIPALFALGEELGSSGRDLLDAYLAGFETHQRFSNVLLPHHYNNGWHPTATIGTFGATAAVARLLKLDVQQTATALSLAASMASGVKANFGTMGKPFHAGQCGRNGLLAALLVKEGFTANVTALEHKAGFFQAYDGLENLDLGKLVNDWPAQFAISRGPWGLKPYPCCGSTHPAIRSVFELRKKHGADLDPASIRAVKIVVYKDRIPHTNNPFPKSPLQAKFSIQYTTARALVSGAVRLDDFEGTAYTDSTIQHLLDVTTVEARPPSDKKDITETYAGAVTVTTADGRELTGEVSGVLGPGSEQPLTEDELWEKFSDCASRTHDKDTSRELFDTLLALPEQQNLDGLIKLLERTK